MSSPGWVRGLPLWRRTSPSANPAPLPRREQGLGRHRKPLYRGRQSGSAQAAAGGVSGQGEDDLY